jgi:hypothetical protein
MAPKPTIEYWKMRKTHTFKYEWNYKLWQFKQRLRRRVGWLYEEEKLLSKFESGKRTIYTTFTRRFY